jgi:hypothetical protein
METPLKRGRGRPAGKELPHVKLVRLSDADVSRLDALARQWKCSEAQALRRLLREVSGAVPDPDAAKPG